MTTAADWYAFHARIDPINTAEALQTALADPAQSWYAHRRLKALAATGVLVAASWNPLLHPRGRDGKFIEKYGWVRWLDQNMAWRSGWVEDIDGSTGAIHVRSGLNHFTFGDARKLYAKPKPKARLKLPDVLSGVVPSGWKKTGGQGGSNPGGFYDIVEITDDNNKWPEITSRSLGGHLVTQMAASGTAGDISSGINPTSPEQNAVFVPSIDGAADRYDFAIREGTKWYRVPATGPMTENGAMKADLEVFPDDLFGAVGSPRRDKTVNNLNSWAFTLNGDYNADDYAGFVQGIATPKPKIGDRYYVKTMPTTERAHNEALANDLYELLGIPVPDVSIGDDGKTVSSKLLGEKVKFDPDNPTHIKAAQDGFVADAWLANWDSVGMEFDNMQVDPDGNVWRVDAGGALLYRAMVKSGEKGAMFGDTVGEITSLRDYGINPQAAHVFGAISSSELVRQAEVIRSIQPVRIRDLVDANDMPSSLADRLIARRQNILDQFGLTDPYTDNVSLNTAEPEIVPEPELPMVLSPVPDLGAKITTDIAKMGTGPEVHVDNYTQAIKNLPAAVVQADDWEAPEFYNTAVWKLNGDLWAFASDFEKLDNGARFVAENLITGERDQVAVFDGSESWLSGFEADTPITEALVDMLKVQRALGNEETIGKAMASGKSLNEIMETGTFHTGVEPFHLYEFGLPFSHVQQAIDDGRLGPDSAPWPIRDGLGDVWHVTFADDNTVKLTPAGYPADSPLGPPIPLTLTKEQFDTQTAGPWWRPGNETTAKLWEAEAAQHYATVLSFSQESGGEKATLDNWLQTGVSGHDEPDEPDPVPADTPPGPVPMVVDPGLKVADPELEALLNEEQAIYDQMVAANQPTVSQAIINGVAAKMLPYGDPLLTTEMSVDDIDELKAQLIGKNVVVLPTALIDDPAGNTKVSGRESGFGTVTDVTTSTEYIYGHYDAADNYHPTEKVQAVRVAVKFGDGTALYVTGIDAAADQFTPRQIIPVEAQMSPGKATLKNNHQVVLNGTAVGTWVADSWNINITIDGDHSLTGHPLTFQTNGKTQARNFVQRYTTPIVPPVKVPKPVKVYKTQNEINDLNNKLFEVEEQISALKFEKADAQISLAFAPGPETGGDVPLGDGTFPKIGDWVFSTKDGRWGQIAQVSPKFGAKNKADPTNYVRVKFEIDGKKVSINRTRSTLVSAAGPGEKPWVLQTKAVQAKDGAWIGPGTKVWVQTGLTGIKVTILDTDVSGKVKILKDDGTKAWVNASAVTVPILSDPWTLKQPPGAVDIDALNAQLAVLQDTKHALALEIAVGVKPPPKKKKPIGTPYPGPNSQTVKQPAFLAKDREDAGLKNYKDGYAPAVGQILRHNDGTQWVVTEVGKSTGWNTSHKNSVRVVPVGSGWPEKWKANSTLVMDHEAMLTFPASHANAGQPIPVVTTINGAHPDLPLNSLRFLYRVPVWNNYKDSSGKYRKVEWDNWLVQDVQGNVYKLGSGEQIGSYQIDGAEKVAYIDVGTADPYTGPNPQTLTVSQGEKNGVGTIYWTAIADPATNPATLFGGQYNPPTVVTSPVPPGAIPEGEQADWQGQTVKVLKYTPAGWVIIKDEFGDTVTVKPSALTALSTAPTAPAAPPPHPNALPDLSQTLSGPQFTTPTAPIVNQPIPQVTNPKGNVPTDPELPKFTGAAPEGQENPHPSTLKGGTNIGVYKPTGGTPINRQAVPGTRSIAAAVNDTVAAVNANKGVKMGEGQWSARYALGDGDMVEDMQFQTQVVRDSQGNDRVEVRFQLTRSAAKAAHNTFMVASSGEVGDWAYDKKKPTGMAIGDQINVRISQYETYTGKLKPSNNEVAPNATITEGPILIGKNPSGQFDVYRFEVVTAKGDVGYIDLEDRGAPSIWVAMWDPTKPKVTNSAKSLNPNAQDDGWTVKHSHLVYDRQLKSGGGEAGGGSGDLNANETNPDGSKILGEKYTTASLGRGWVIQRDYQGGHIEYSTTDDRNSRDGWATISVDVNDPQAQRKISEMMEMVGLTPQAQQPPDRAAIARMALNKVWVQYRDHWNVEEVSNATLADPSDALAVLNKQLAGAMGRDATIDDISVKIHDDGRVQVLLSKDVANALTKRNKAKVYIHKLASKGSKPTVEMSTSGASPGLMASTERLEHGLFFFGESTADDHRYGSANYSFFTMLRTDPSTSRMTIVAHPDAVHRQVDFYWRTGDSMGARDPYSNVNFVTMGSIGGRNELMIRRRIEPQLISHIVVPSEYDRDQIIARLHKRGITTAPNGKLLEDYFVLSGQTPVTEPVWGVEIPLLSLTATTADDAPVVAPIAAVPA